MTDTSPSFPLPTRAARKWATFGLAAFCFLEVATYPAAIALSGPLLGALPTAGKADVMVVLGGDGPARADYALSLWRQRAAGKVLVTGDGDCTSIRDVLVAGGVPDADVTIECRSGSTWENAEFSAPILTAMGAHSALIVTNWFHARRALESFNAMCPGFSFSVASVPAPPFATIVTGPYGSMVMAEYPKTAVYALRLWLRGVLGGAPQAAGGQAWQRC
ncbi:MAG TPA: YdcF family protein [Devosiaceae bacterium]